jgi:hypothetical protein
MTGPVHFLLNSSSQKVCKRRFPRFAVERIGRVLKGGAVEQTLNVAGPVIGKGPERSVIDSAWEDVSFYTLLTTVFQTFQCGQADRAHRRALLAVCETQTSRRTINLTPSQLDDLAAPASGQRDQAGHLCRNFILSILNCVAQDITERTIFLLAQAPPVDIVPWLANAMSRVLLNDAKLGSVTENPA